VKYEPAAKPMKPSGRCQPGARALLDLMLYLTPGLISSGCYNARKIVGSSDVSLHAEGRALDVRPANFAYTSGSWLTRDPARALTYWCDALIEHHQALGIQQIIWAGWSWRVGQATWRQLSPSANQHYDHAHIELTWAAARDLTPERITAVLFPPTPEAPNMPDTPDALTRSSFLTVAASMADVDRGKLLEGGVNLQPIPPYARRVDLARIESKVDTLAGLAGQLSAMVDLLEGLAANGVSFDMDLFAAKVADVLAARLVS